jgi:hypothetical protein
LNDYWLWPFDYAGLVTMDKVHVMPSLWYKIMSLKFLVYMQTCTNCNSPSVVFKFAGLPNSEFCWGLAGFLFFPLSTQWTTFDNLWAPWMRPWSTQVVVFSKKNCSQSVFKGHLEAAVSRARKAVWGGKPLNWDSPALHCSSWPPPAPPLTWLIALMNSVNFSRIELDVCVQCHLFVRNGQRVWLVLRIC